MISIKSDRRSGKSKQSTQGIYASKYFSFSVITCIQSINSLAFLFLSPPAPFPFFQLPGNLFIFMSCFNSKIIRRQNHHPPNIAIQYLHSTIHTTATYQTCLYQEDLLHQSFPHRRVRHRSPELPRRRCHTPLLLNLQPALRLPPSPAPSTPMRSSLTTLPPITRHR